MAETIVSIAVETLTPFVKQKVNLAAGVTKEVGKLSRTFTAIQAVLNDAESKQAQNELIRDWLRKLKDVAYDVDDILDEWRIEEAIRSEINGKVCTYLLPSFFCFNRLVFRDKIAHKIKDIRETLDQINAKKTGFGLTENIMVDTSERQTSSLVDESEIFGRQEEKESIISKLMSESSQRERWVPVISIVGMGGIGKTTLAQLVYNDERVITHFQKRMWVCVSTDFDVKQLTKEIIEVACQPDHKLDVRHVTQLETLQQHLRDILKEKRLLLVLDNVWNENEGKWDTLKRPFQFGAPGSRVVITTRNAKVVERMSTSYMHSLKALSDEDCWSLFSSKAFLGRAEEECLKLKDIGWKIVNKCKGMPLAAKTIGSVMRSKKTVQDWQLILGSDMWDLPEVEKNILPALMLSYYHLPSHLKQPFAYCAVFPKDHKIKKDVLIKLWMAQGFIRPDGKSTMEDIGAEYFDDLLGNSLFQALRDDANIVGGCTLHDRVHDLTQFVTNGESSVMDDGKPESELIRTRHLSLSIGSDAASTEFYNSKKLRTLIFSGFTRINLIHVNLIQRLRFLRVLDFSDIDIEELPSSFEKLKLLRYLDISKKNIEVLPESICKLYNLQTLKLNKCKKLHHLPEGMKKMTNLRHLEIEGTDKLSYLPEGIGRLSSLQTLSKFVLGENGTNNIGELKDLNLLRGQLEIDYIERIANGHEARKAELGQKELQNLWLFSTSRWDFQRHTLVRDEVERMEGVLEGLRPPISICVLGIDNHIGYKFPSWLSDSSFSNLVKLTLINCKNAELPSLGKLPFLRYLCMKGMDAVTCVDHEFYGFNDTVKGAFPKLETLIVNYFKHWEQWDLRMEDGGMPSLLKLVITSCTKLKALPPQLPQTLRELQITHCDRLTWMPSRPPALEKLVIEGRVGMLKSLPRLPNLKFLQISFCYNLETIPPGLGQLETLRTLEIRDCSDLKSLPEELQHLETLRDLIIFNCPVLKERCRKLEGGDWLKIAHISNIQVDNEKIQ